MMIYCDSLGYIVLVVGFHQTLLISFHHSI